MKKILTVMASSILFTSIAQASPTIVAVSKQVKETNEITLPVSLNNQSKLDITTDSNFVPADAKDIAPQGNAIFDVKIPQAVGTQVIRYTSGNFGCDFYIDTQKGGPMGDLFVSYITAVPVDTQTMCNVFKAGDVNHLAVSFYTR